MNVDIVEFVTLSGGEKVTVTISMPVPDGVVDQRHAKMITTMTMGPLCRKVVRLFAGTYELYKGNPVAGDQSLVVIEKKLSEASTECADLAREARKNIEKNIEDSKVAESFRFVMNN